jgi:biotin carboxylase
VTSSRSLLVLGAGPAQLGLLEAARRRDDLTVIAVDRDPLAPGLALAHERAILSSEDEQGIDRLARARDVDGIVSPGADWPVGIAARIADRMGLPHPLDAATAVVATSKVRQRERFAERRVPHPAALDEATGISLPCVVKAVDRQGQRGLTLVRTQAELGPALEHARAESRGGGVLVEELVAGPEVTVNAVSVDGHFFPLLVTDRLTAEPPAFGVALAHVWPSVAATESVLEVARAAVEAVGISNGPSYTQLCVGRDGPVAIEVAARLGGGHDAELAHAVRGVDLAALAIRFALGEPIEVPEPVDTAGRAAGCVVFLVPPEGVLEGVEGEAEAAAAEGVAWVRVYRRPGHVFGRLLRGADRAGAALAVGSDRGEALERAHRAAGSIRFRIAD